MHKLNYRNVWLLLCIFYFSQFSMQYWGEESRENFWWFWSLCKNESSLEAWLLLELGSHYYNSKLMYSSTQVFMSKHKIVIFTSYLLKVYFFLVIHTFLDQLMHLNMQKIRYKSSTTFFDANVTIPLLCQGHIHEWIHIWVIYLYIFTTYLPTIPRLKLIMNLSIASAVFSKTHQTHCIQGRSA